MDDPDAAAAVCERYARFARDEAPGRSAVYAEWAAGVAADPGLAAVLARIPVTRRQPPFVFAVTRLLGAPVGGYPAWAAWVRDHADDVVRECAARSLQTNEPQRCAVLLPALALVDGPIALLEVGASAGLCLQPYRYSYRYRAAGAETRIDPAGGGSGVLLDCEVRAGAPPLRAPRIVWRAGIDLHPLDPRDPDDRDWLTALVWPGETGRERRIRGALDLAAAHPARIVAGDAADALAALAAEAPADATLVVTTPGVLAHVPHTDRERIIAQARAAAHWITLDAPWLHEAWNAPIDPSDWPQGAFALALDGDVVAAADPLGGWLEWRPGIGDPPR